MAPKFRGAVFNRYQGYLQIVNSGAGKFHIACQLSQSLPESRARNPYVRPATLRQGVKKAAGFFGRGWPPATCRMRDHTPEFGNTGQRNSPTSAISAGALNGPSGGPVLGNMPALSVNQQVGVNGDHGRAPFASIPTSDYGWKGRARVAARRRRLPSECEGDGAAVGC